MSNRSVILILCVVSIWVRFRLADLADWGVDEAANLWLASGILSGKTDLLGLVSSVGVRNLAGVPLIGIPFTLFPDLLSISRGLSVVQLTALVFLSFSLGGKGGWRIFGVCLLLFFPSLILASFSLWNQYLILPVSTVNLALLLFLLGGRSGGVLRAVAASAVVGFSLLEPAVHLMGFAELCVHLLLLCAVLAVSPRPFDTSAAAVCMLILGGAAAALYVPWIEHVATRVRGASVLPFFFTVLLAIVAGARMLHVRRLGMKSILNRVLEAGGRSRALSWMVLAVMITGLAMCTLLSLQGAQPGDRLLNAGAPFGVALLTVQAALALSLLPALSTVVRKCIKGSSCRDLIVSCFPAGAPAAALVLVHGGFLLAGRLVLSPCSFLPLGRCDLLVSLVPAVLAPWILLVQNTRYAHVRAVTLLASALAVAVPLLFVLSGPSRAFWSGFPRFVPPSEMRVAVDYVAALHQQNRGGKVIDLGYDLEQGREWIAEKVTRFPGFRWYSIGRPYDWLLLRRHGLVNAHEGAVERRGGNGYQLGYACDGEPSPEMKVLLRLDHLQIRQRQKVLPGPRDF